MPAVPSIMLWIVQKPKHFSVTFDDLQQSVKSCTVVSGSGVSISSGADVVPPDIFFDETAFDVAFSAFTENPKINHYIGALIKQVP